MLKILAGRNLGFVAKRLETIKTWERLQQCQVCKCLVHHWTGRGVCNMEYCGSDMGNIVSIFFSIKRGDKSD